MNTIRCTLVVLAAFGLGGAAESAKADLPNIILIFADDQGYGDVGAYGSKIKTPNMDRIGAEGMKFTDFYVGCAVCSGSRTALLTGAHYQRVSMAPVLFPRSNAGLHPDEETIPEVLKSKGYATACIGKWHLGHLPPCLPTQQGFDYYYGIPYSNDMWIDPKAKRAAEIKLNDGWTNERIDTEKYKRNDSPVMRNEEIVEFPVDQTQITRLYAEEAVKFIDANKDGPFFLYLPSTMPHLPLFASEKFKDKSGLGIFGDVIMELDWSVGEVLKALDRNGIADNTLVIFTTDNGTARGSSGPLRAKKASPYEGGVRVPCMMRWPGKIPAGKVCGEVAATIDVLPTLAAITGADLPKKKIDGRDIRPLMFGEEGAKSPHDAYVLLYKGGSVRSGKWKYYPWPEGAGGGKKKGQKPPAPVKGPKVQLYDLSTDLGETKNVAEANPDVVKRLHAAFEALKADIEANKRPTMPMKREG